MGRYKKTYYSMYSKDGFGVYSSKYRMDDAADYTIPIETGEFQSKDEAFWFAQDGFDSLCLGVSSEELTDGQDIKINWFYRISKNKR